MKNTYKTLFTIGLTAISSITFAQTLGSRTSINQEKTDAPAKNIAVNSINISEIRNELTAWDPVRGEWLANSMTSISNQSAVPDRNFPENVSPQELYAAVPTNVRDRINNVTSTSLANAQTETERQQWQRMQRFVNRPGCNLVSGKTFGDPHLKSFDGESYSFQTVGEFVLANSSNGDFEVQVRQQAQNDDFSLNTAVAMNVAGDRVSVYANNYENRGFRSNLHVNSQEIIMNSDAFFLPNGGVIRRVTKGYDIIWPNGERVLISERRSGSMEFFNVEAQIYPCGARYEGLLGNANGSRHDDYDMRGSGNGNIAWSTFGGPSRNDAMEKEYLAFLARDFARSWRITPMTSLFDYANGMSTYSYTDESYPRVHHTLNGLSQTDRDNARKVCEGRGVRQDEMNGCIYDQGYLRIEPDAGRDYNNPIPNGRLDDVSNPRPNVNTAEVIKPRSVPVVNPGGEVERPTNDNLLKPVEERNINQNRPQPINRDNPVIRNEKETKENVIVNPKPVENNYEKPIERNDRNIEKPQTESKPAPVPAPRVEKKPVVIPPKPVSNPPAKPAPVVKPTPAPKPSGTTVQPSSGKVGGR